MLAMSTSNARRFTPVAVDDTANANSGETIHIDVLVNDERLDDGVARLIVSTPPEFGEAVAEQSAPFSINYTSVAGFGGTDTFTYIIEDIHEDTSQPATVTIQVNGSIAETQESGLNKIVFGGEAFPGSNVPLSAAGEEAEEPGISKTGCCTVLDTRVGNGNQWGPFDIGDAMGADGACADMFADLGISAPLPDTLIVPRHFGVHTDPEDEDLTTDDFKFGVCVVDTTAEWDGPVQVDIVAEPVVGYAVNCENPEGVDKQPLTLGLSTVPTEFTSPEMRAITSECDPRGVTRWSRWYFVVNAVHLTEQEDSRTYVRRMALVIKNMIETMRQAGVADSAFLNDIKTLVLNAEAAIGSKKWTQAQATSAMDTLDDATLVALTPPGDDTYSPTASFSNPKGELVSHLAALRYAVCSELAHPHPMDLKACKMDDRVDSRLPTLPQPPEEE
jgi:hypothetical protein